jgi:hypothetical protein
LILALLLALQDDRTLFDFEEPAELARWSSVDAENGRPARWELSDGQATSGTHSLKITFDGGRWPAVTTPIPLEDWMPYARLAFDLTVDRPCLVGVAALQEKSSRGKGWDPVVSRWTKTVFAQPGLNRVVEPLHRNDWQAINAKLGKVTSFEIFMYHPRPGEAIFVDNIRLLAKKEPEPKVERRFKVLGTDWIVTGVAELGKKLKDQWKKPEPRTVDEVEAEFRALHEKFKADHPGALLAVFRDGENGYAGWRDAYFNSHGPDGMTIERSENFGKSASQEIFMRHRSPLMKADLSSIPAGSRILAARLIIVRANAEYDKGRNPESNPNMWVAEPCNRPWVEEEVNAYEYAKDKFWKAIGGQHYGDDPDFLPLYLAWGPGGGKVNAWDFTEAVRFWTDGVHANHGFMLHGDSFDWMGRAWYREAPVVKDRPALLVSFVPK